jgi:sporulation protein YqfC
MKNRKPRSAFPGLSLELSGRMPIIEFTGNRRVLIEGSTGVLRYESEVVSINTRSMTVTFNGRGLTLKSISPTAVIIDGIITDTRFES